MSATRVRTYVPLLLVPLFHSSFPLLFLHLPIPLFSVPGFERSHGTHFYEWLRIYGVTDSRDVDSRCTTEEVVEIFGPTEDRVKMYFSLTESLRLVKWVSLCRQSE